MRCDQNRKVSGGNVNEKEKVLERLAIDRVIRIEQKDCGHISALLELNESAARSLFEGRDCLVVVKRYVVTPKHKDSGRYEKSPTKIPSVRNGVEGHIILREAHEKFVPLHYHGGRHKRVCEHAEGKLCVVG